MLGPLPLRTDVPPSEEVAGPYTNDEDAFVTRLGLDDGITGCVKLRRAPSGGRPPVLLRCRPCVEKRGMLGGSAAVTIGPLDAPLSSAPGIAGSECKPLTKGAPDTSGGGGGGGGPGLVDRDRALPFATRMESRMGLRRSPAEWGASSSAGGMGGSATSSCSPMEGRLRNDSAVSQR